MKQVTQKLREGKVKIVESPVPLMKDGEVLVQNHYSCISVGTESSKVKAARKGYLGKAKERPEQVKQVIRALKTSGLLSTYRAVMKKLDAESPLGYSCAGQIIDVAPDVSSFAIGDYVACGGSSASHAEIISVPENLCVKLSSNCDLKQAAYNSLGAIALQGIRQADLRLGECCAVIGLGLIGQLTCALLQASGVKVAAIDIDDSIVQLANDNCADIAIVRNHPGIEQRLMHFTAGMGFDAVIITASSNSLDPINFAGRLCRKKGTIVVVGAIPTGFSREPDYYQKELSIKMSCSYGPGRYDSKYENKGMDYPFAYVRWTEKRNMIAFQELISLQKVDLSFLTTHLFKFESAADAYNMMLSKNENFLGILLEYNTNQKPKTYPPIFIASQPAHRKGSTLSIGFIGAGSYAQNYLLPNLHRSKSVRLRGVMTNSSTGSLSVAERYNFDFCTSNVDDILNDQKINTVFIATRHDSHAKYTIDALKKGKIVFIEKPLCLSIEELDKIRSIIKNISGSANQVLMVGYNRRFSPLCRRIKKHLSDEPLAISYRINAGAIPAESWIQDPEIGGGRIIGEVCHFVDFLIFLCGSLPHTVYATAMADTQNLFDTLSIDLTFQNGSIGNICYFSNGSNTMPKEKIEVFQSGISAIIDDFRNLSLYSQKGKTTKKLLSQDKGQKNEIARFLNAVEEGIEMPIPIEEIFSTSLVTFKIIESIKTRKPVYI
jgi:polar amino acid transport system substrate-binding protein